MFKTSSASGMRANPHSIGLSLPLFRCDQRASSSKFRFYFCDFFTKPLASFSILCYIVDTGCSDSTSYAYTGCTSLLMQPAPLTGAATAFCILPVPLLKRCNPHPLRGRQRTGLPYEFHQYQDAIRTPYGDGNDGSKSAVSTA